MKQGGYTIIELVIALAITATLLALTLPRFDAFQNHNSLRAQAQTLAKCLQAANTSITSPAIGSSGSQAVVTIGSSESAAQVTCDYTVQDESLRPVSSTPSIPNPIQTVIANDIYVCTPTTYGTYTSQNFPISFTLYATTHGIIDAVTFGSQPLQQSNGGPGQGQKMVMQFSTTKQQAGISTCTDPVTLTIPGSGSPIEVSS